MTELSVSSPALATYAAAVDTVAAELSGAAAAMTACGPVVLAPVFGLIGTEFSAAFTVAHTAHTGAVAELAAVVTSIGVAASSSAVGYAATDAASADSIGAHR